MVKFARLILILGTTFLLPLSAFSQDYVPGQPGEPGQPNGQGGRGGAGGVSTPGATIVPGEYRAVMPAFEDRAGVPGSSGEGGNGGGIGGGAGGRSGWSIDSKQPDANLELAMAKLEAIESIKSCIKIGRPIEVCVNQGIALIPAACVPNQGAPSAAKVQKPARSEMATKIH